jgi:hypothetical protein
MEKIKFNALDAEKVKTALAKLKNDTLSEISAEFVTGNGCSGGKCGCDWSKSKHSKGQN